MLCDFWGGRFSVFQESCTEKVLLDCKESCPEKVLLY